MRVVGRFLVRLGLAIGGAAALPVVTVTHTRRFSGTSRIVAETVIAYDGKVEGCIDGQQLSSCNGLFTVLQPFEVTLHC